MTTQPISKLRKGDVFWFTGRRYTAMVDPTMDDKGWVYMTAQRTHGGVSNMRLTEDDIVTVKTDDV